MLRVGSHSVCKHCFNTLLLIRYQQQRGAKWTSTAVRQSFLDFFCHNDHKYVPSSSVIPKKNEGTYFTNAGMNQVRRNYFVFDSNSDNACLTRACRRDIHKETIQITSIFISKYAFCVPCT